MNELLPCPFCGGEAVFHDSLRPPETYPCRVYCDNCWAEVGGYSTEAEAIEAWNTRVNGSETAKTSDSAPLRTCEEYGSVRVWQSCNVWSHELSCGHEVDTLDSEPPNYCPNCGARVVA